MPDPIQNKLGAYLDGELNRREAQEVERHLEICMDCRTELDELRQVSGLLHTAALPEFTSPAGFKSQLMLQLPRREGSSQSVGRAKFLWAGPVLVVVLFILLEVVINTATVMSFTGLPVMVTVGPRGSGQMLWYSLLQWLPGDLANTPAMAWLNILNEAGLFTQGMVIRFFGLVGIAVLYWGVFSLAWRSTVSRSTDLIKS